MTTTIYIPPERTELWAWIRAEAQRRGWSTGKLLLWLAEVKRNEAAQEGTSGK